MGTPVFKCHETDDLMLDNTVDEEKKMNATYIISVARKLR